MNIADYKGVWVFAEQREGELQKVSLELLGEGRRVADKLGVKQKQWKRSIGHVQIQPFLFQRSGSAAQSGFLRQGPGPEAGAGEERRRRQLQTGVSGRRGQRFFPGADLA